LTLKKTSGIIFSGFKMIALKIKEIAKKDMGKGFARLNPDDMQEIGVDSWDLVEIGGKRKTIVRVMPLEKSLRHKSVIQIDTLTRENARVDIDEHVFVKKVDSKSATKVVLSPGITSFFITATKPNTCLTAWTATLLPSETESGSSSRARAKRSSM